MRVLCFICSPGGCDSPQSGMPHRGREGPHSFLSVFSRGASSGWEEEPGRHLPLHAGLRKLQIRFVLRLAVGRAPGPSHHLGNTSVGRGISSSRSPGGRAAGGLRCLFTHCPGPEYAESIREHALLNPWLMLCIQTEHMTFLGNRTKKKSTAE